MANRLGPIDVYCEAPPYAIVQACRQVGIHTPEDVRWRRLSHYLKEHLSWKETFLSQPWRIFVGADKPEERSCSCGRKLPDMRTVTFTFVTGEEMTYCLGQCLRCWTVFWDDP